MGGMFLESQGFWCVIQASSFFFTQKNTGSSGSKKPHNAHALWKFVLDIYWILFEGFVLKCRAVKESQKGQTTSARKKIEGLCHVAYEKSG